MQPGSSARHTALYNQSHVCFVVQVWLQHTQDPVIQPDAQEVIDALASHASCFPSLVGAAAPTLAAILQRGAAVRMARQQGQSPEAAAAAGAAAVGLVPVPEETSMLVEASLDLLRTLVKPGQDATTLEVCCVYASFNFEGVSAEAGRVV